MLSVHPMPGYTHGLCVLLCVENQPSNAHPRIGDVVGVRGAVGWLGVMSTNHSLSKCALIANTRCVLPHHPTPKPPCERFRRHAAGGEERGFTRVATRIAKTTQVISQTNHWQQVLAVYIRGDILKRTCCLEREHAQSPRLCSQSVGGTC